MIGRGSSSRVLDPHPQRGHCHTKPAMVPVAFHSFMGLPKRLEISWFGWSSSTAISTTPSALVPRKSSAWGSPRFSSRRPPRPSGPGLLHFIKTDDGPAQILNRADNILPASKETHRRPTARLGLRSFRPLASVGKESHQSQGRPLFLGLPRARFGTQAQFREQRRAVSGWDLGLGSG